jgi:hypothetical protein
MISADALVIVISYGHALPPNAESDCDPTGGDPSRPVECLPWTGTGDGRGAYFLPNHSLTVYVVLPSTDGTRPTYLSSVTATPNAGTSPPGIVPASTTAKLGAAVGAGATCVVDEYVLAPRPAGPFTVAASLTDKAGKAIAGSSHAIELVVETVYIGAVRVSLGLSFPTVGARSWSVRSTSGGGTAIYEDAYSPAVFEVMAGYTAFFASATGRKLAHLRVGWYSGLGVVSSTPPSGNLTVFDAAYTGLEFSGAGFSLQFLAGIRRDTVLANGFQVGSHVSGTSVPTTTTFDFAPGIALGFTSDVFKIAGISSP